jgi:hypothetical protein
MRPMLPVSLALAAHAQAQTSAAPDFPADAKPIAADMLKERLAGKVFRVATAGGAVWRWQFQSNGYFFINVGSFAESGKWRTEASAVCSEPQRSKASCNEMRLVGDGLQMKRDNGEIVKLEPQ